MSENLPIESKDLEVPEVFLFMRVQAAGRLESSKEPQEHSFEPGLGPSSCVHRRFWEFFSVNQTLTE
jgi:hypothetical protein